MFAIQELDLTEATIVECRHDATISGSIRRFSVENGVLAFGWLADSTSRKTVFYPRNWNICQIDNVILLRRSGEDRESSPSSDLPWSTADNYLIILPR